MKRLVAVLMCVWISGCEVVHVSDAARLVQVVGMNEVEGCDRLSEITVSTTYKLGFIKRDHYTVQTELYDLARNEGAKQGGNRLVPVSELIDGVQRFGLYRCAVGAMP